MKITGRERSGRVLWKKQSFIYRLCRSSAIQLKGMTVIFFFRLSPDHFSLLVSAVAD